MTLKSPGSRVHHPGRWCCELPYGMWTCADGREVLYDRHYCPLWERRGSESKRADRSEWVYGIVQHVWFYNDGCTPRANRKRRARCRQVLEAFVAGGSISEFVFNTAQPRAGTETEMTKQQRRLHADAEVVVGLG